MNNKYKILLTKTLKEIKIRIIRNNSQLNQFNKGNLIIYIYNKYFNYI